MDIRRQRVARHTQRADPPFTLHAKAQHDDHRQRQAIGAQLHSPPPVGPTPELPASGITTQPGNGPAMSQQ